MQTGHIREQSQPRRLVLGPDDHHPPRPICDTTDCGRRSDIIERDGTHLCSVCALEKLRVCAS
jgi:hypothetical protein